MFDKMIARGLLAAAVAAAALTAQADVFNLSNGQISLQFVPVGDAGNVANTAGTAAVGHPLGAVSYPYSIGTYDVTAAQYTAFLNAVATTSDPCGLYNPSMAAVGGDPNSAGGCGITQTSISGSYSYSVAATYQNFPVNYINWGDAARFCNWLQNGQPTGGTEGTGTTETGSYTLNGANDDSTLATVTRNPGATYYLPTEDEWYKAAYYVGGGTNAGYYAYPTKNNLAPTAVAPAAPGDLVLAPNSANYNTVASDTYLTSVGTYLNSPGPYGTFDQGGDLYQWTDTPATWYYGPGFEMFGGSWESSVSELSSTNYIFPWSPASSEYNFTGFRVVAVPEPSTLCLLAATLALFGGRSLFRRW
jgi:formylglycine-generating enzyme required for sulfatase activity